MASEKDLIDKADALLKRHALGAGNETGTYPVLTDLVVPPELQQEDATPPEDDRDARLRDEIVARVLAELRTSLGVELEREVAEKLAPQLRTAVAEALAGLEDRLAAIVSDAVTASLKDRLP